MKNGICYFIIGLLFSGCEKPIHFDLKSSNPKLVVEATIENDQYPIVVLTRSVNYFARFSYGLLDSAFVHNADVTISNGTLTQHLKEYGASITNGFTFYYYTTDPGNTATAFKGELNHAYKLNIQADAEQYSATTTIPNFNKVIDSLFWKPAPVADSNKVVLMIKATDPPGYGDYIRYFTRTNSGPFLAPLNSVFDDLFIDGTTYTIQLEPGVDRNAKRTDDEHYFNRGDIVTLKLSSIDRATYDFWRTMEYSYASVGNPFSTPTKVLSNISNNALGYFGGYASQYVSVKIQ
jgi:Domain of unknown function (DUF4249)